MKKFFSVARCLSFMFAFCVVVAFGACKQQQIGRNTPDNPSNPSNPDNPSTTTKEELDCSLNNIPFKMVLIPGCEKPQRLGTEGYGKLRYVTLSPFYMLETEVTQELYEAVMGDNPSYFTDSDLEDGEIQAKRPVEKVSWIDAVVFCNELTKKVMGEEECVYDIGGGPVEKNRVKIIFNKHGKIERKGFRLPSESEWEWAARGGYYQVPQYIGPILPKEDFEGMDNLSEEDYTKKYFELVKKCRGMINEYAWVGKPAGNKTHQVALKKPNPYKLYDMGGNVYEWCYDTLIKFYDKNDKDFPDYIKLGEEVPEDIVFHDWFGPIPQKPKMFEVFKGGSFFYQNAEPLIDKFISHTTCEYRAGAEAEGFQNYIGFRIACGVLNGQQ